MASDVDICNLALGYLGDSANISALTPPDSVQAEHCQRFYPIARDSLLNMHNWGFATRRVSPSQIAVAAEASGMWRFAYILPADCLTVQRVYDPSASDDLVSAIPQPYDGWWPGSTSSPMPNTIGMGAVVPQPFSIETDANGDDILYTNQVNAAIVYTGRITDTTKFDPSFVVALAWLLAGYLAGPVIKGTEGIKMAQACGKAFKSAFGDASSGDANERRINMPSVTPWLAAR